MVTQTMPAAQPRQINPYRYEPTSSLLANLECRLWDRSEIAADLENDADLWVGGEGNLEFCDVQIELIVQELDRRERLRLRADSPPWPLTSISLGPDKDLIKSTLRIEDYLECRGVLLNRFRSGRAVTVCCLPGHDDHAASFSINTEKQLWHCFGCGRGGDIFLLHQHMIGDPDFVRTVYELAEEAGIATEKRHAS